MGKILDKIIDKLKDKRTRIDIISTLFFLIIGILVIFTINKLVGLILMFGGAGISYKEIIEVVKYFLNLNKNSQEMVDSPGGVQQIVEKANNSNIAGRDITNIKIGSIDLSENLINLEIYFDPDNTHKSHFDQITKKKAFFTHVMVRNSSNKRARNCYGELVELSEYSEGSYMRVPTFNVPVELKWANVTDFSKKDIEPETPRRLDVAHTIQNHPRFYFFTDRTPRGVQTDFPSGEYKIKIKVAGDNTNTAYGTFYIKWDGRWNHIRISDTET